MNTFKRYLSIFLIIGCIIFVFGLILIAKDKSIFSWKMVLGFIIAILVYVVPMSLFLSYQASVVKIQINKSNVDIIKEIDSIATNKCNRKSKEVYDDYVLYKMENDFSAWLTNPITVSNYEDYIVLKVPRAYAKYYYNLA